MRERERETDRDRDRERQTETERQTQTRQQTDRQTDRQTNRDREAETEAATFDKSSVSTEGAIVSETRNSGLERKTRTSVHTRPPQSYSATPH